MQKLLDLIFQSSLLFLFALLYYLMLIHRHLQRLRKKSIKKTKSEKEYNKLEPWIQWPSFYTGKSFENHNIYRLGDFDKYSGENILKYWVDIGREVVCISPMNLTNSLKHKNSRYKMTKHITFVPFG